MTSTLFHILIVEDEDIAAEQMAEFLRDNDFRVTVAPNAVDALTLHEGDAADLIVTDLRMPGGDGFHLIRSLRDGASAIPIIVVTGHILRDAEAELLEKSATVVLRKPINLRELLTAIEDLRP